MSVLQADTVACGPLPRVHRIRASMRRAEIQQKGDFGQGAVTLLNRYAKVARTGEVAVDIRAKAEISESLRRPPFAEFGSMFTGFHHDVSPRP